jgi:hypothetical protein
MGKNGETFPVPHAGNGSKDSKWWFLSVVFVLSGVEEVIHVVMSARNP